MENNIAGGTLVVLETNSYLTSSGNEIGSILPCPLS
jgi:hypothetical protein